MKINCLVILYYKAMFSLIKLNKFFKSLWLFQYSNIFDTIWIFSIFEIYVKFWFQWYMIWFWKKFLSGWVIFEANSLQLIVRTPPLHRGMRFMKSFKNGCNGEGGGGHGKCLLEIRWGSQEWGSWFYNGGGWEVF